MLGGSWNGASGGAQEMRADTVKSMHDSLFLGSKLPSFPWCLSIALFLRPLPFSLHGCFLAFSSTLLPEHFSISMFLQTPNIVQHRHSQRVVGRILQRVFSPVYSCPVVAACLCFVDLKVLSGCTCWGYSVAINHTIKQIQYFYLPKMIHMYFFEPGTVTGRMVFRIHLIIWKSLLSGTDQILVSGIWHVW